MNERTPFARGIARQRLYRWVAGLGCVLVAILLLACPVSPMRVPKPPTTAATLAQGITLYSWVDYMPQDVLDDFEREYGVHVRYVTFESMSEAVATLRTGGVAADVVVLEFDALPFLIAEGHLVDLDVTRIPNMNHVSPDFRDLAWDPNNRYCAPNMWGTTGLIVRNDLLPRPVSRWSDLWDPAFAGRIALRDLDQDNIALALQSLGHDINTTDAQELEAAERHLMALKPAARIIGVELDATVRLLTSGEFMIVVGWPGEAIAAQKQNAAIQYILPQEGFLLWGDGWCIPATSRHKRTAELFIDYMLRPEVAGKMTNTLRYATANGAAYPYIDPAIATHPALRPAAEDLARGEWLLPHNDQERERRSAIWHRFLAPEPTGGQP